MFLALNMGILAFIFFKQFMQFKKVSTQSVLSILHSVTIGLILGAELFVLYDELSFFIFEKIVKCSLGFIFSTYLCLVCLIIMGTNSSRKIKILWRIPIIGTLTGLYFEMNYLIYILVGYLVLCFAIPFKNRAKFRYLLIKIIPLAFCAVSLYFLNINNLSTLNLTLLICLLASSQLFIISNVNAMFRSMGTDLGQNDEANN